MITKQYNRPKISVYIAMSIDGYIAKEDDNLDWLDSVAGYEYDYGFNEFMNNIDCVILGKKTYEAAVVAYNTPKWPYKNKKLIVLSNSLKEVVEEAELYSGNVENIINELSIRKVKNIWIDGGNTISQFLKLNMVDEMILSIIPVVLGAGISLFHTDRDINCSLISSKYYPSGLVQNKYNVLKPKNNYTKD